VQQRRLHKKSQPTEQLEEVIEEIRRLMLRSTQEEVSKGKLNRRRACHSSREEEDNNNNNKAEEQEDNSKESLGSRRISTELGSS
jgi:hypothetical protein